VSTTASLAELVAPLRADPAHAAILLDVDGTLAPITRHATDAAVPESTRARLSAVGQRYGLVACVSGRRATEARRIVSIGRLTYIGNHGIELLPPGASEPKLSAEMQSWARRVQAFAAGEDTRELSRMRIRLEDKAAIAAFHWRGAPDEATAHAAARGIAGRAEAAGFAIHWGRKVLEVRPPVAFDKGAGIEVLLRDTAISAALYAGDDATDLDAFAALTRMVDAGSLTTAVRVGVRSEEGPTAIVEEADLVVDGQLGINRLLDALVDGGA
jgi:trehalose 6-phosphate phosphatase